MHCICLPIIYKQDEQLLKKIMFFSREIVCKVFHMSNIDYKGQKN